MSSTIDTTYETPVFRLVVNNEEYRRAISFEELEELLIFQAARIEQRKEQGWEIVS